MSNYYDLSKSEAAKYIGKSERSLERYVAKGKLQTQTLPRAGGGFEVRYSSIELDRLKEEKSIPTISATISELTDRENGTLQALAPAEIELQILQLIPVVSRYYELKLLSAQMTFTIVEAAKISGFSQNSLRLAIKSGKLKAVRVGNKWRLRSRALEEYVLHLWDWE